MDMEGFTIDGTATDAVEPGARRLKILGDDEIDAIYARPTIEPEERPQFFSLSQREKELLQTLRTLNSKAYFVLQLGYFKAKRLFFAFDFKEVEEDARFVLEQHFIGRTSNELRPVERQTRFKHRQMILGLFNYRSCDAEQRRELLARAEQAAVICGKPIYIFREIKEHLDKHRIVSPAYSCMQDTVGAAITAEQNRLAAIVRRELQPSAVEALNQLLVDSNGLYEITLLKREPKDFSASEIKREIQRGEQIADLYRLAERLLPVLKISNESIKYYASLVAYYSAFRLRRFDEWTVQVYLLCFVFHRYQRLHDNLISCFIHNVRKYADDSRKAAKEYGLRMPRGEQPKPTKGW